MRGPEQLGLDSKPPTPWPRGQGKLAGLACRSARPLGPFLALPLGFTMERSFPADERLSSKLRVKLPCFLMALASRSSPGCIRVTRSFPRAWPSNLRFVAGVEPGDQAGYADLAADGRRCLSSRHCPAVIAAYSAQVPRRVEPRVRGWSHASRAPRRLVLARIWSPRASCMHQVDRPRRGQGRGCRPQPPPICITSGFSFDSEDTSA